MTTSTSRRAVNSAVTIAAAVTVVVAVGADLLAGSHSAHVALVGVIAIALGVVRARLAGRHRAIFGVLSAVIVAQPAIHAALTLSASGLAAQGLHDLDPDDVTTLANMAFAGAVVVGVGLVEKLLLAVEAAMRSCCEAVLALLGRAPAPTGPVLTTALEPVQPPSRAWVRYEARRGPPLRLAHA